MRLSVGTAQFGFDYGATNTGGKCSPGDVKRILKAALQQKIVMLDTAPAYGDSESVLGQSDVDLSRFEITTKFGPALGQQNAVHASITASLESLKCDHVYGLLVHDVSELLGAHGAARWKELEAVKESGLVSKIGASVYTSEQIDALLDRFPLDIIQLPFSLADQRLHHSGHLKKLQLKNVEIHARSIFLQGTLLTAPDQLPAPLAPLGRHIDGMIGELRNLGLTPLEGCILGVASRPEIDVAIIGASSYSEFETVVATATKMIENLPSIDVSHLGIEDAALLNPATWPTH